MAQALPLVTPINDTRRASNAGGSGMVSGDAVSGPAEAGALAESLSTPRDPVVTLPQDQTAQAPAPQLTDEQKRQMAGAAKRAAAAFGEIVSVMMRVSPYKDMRLSDLQWLVFPAVASGLFSIAEAQSSVTGATAPVGVVTWARVSAEVDQRITHENRYPIQLKPDEWTSGDILWLIDAAGDRNAVNAMLTRLSETQWKGKQVKTIKHHVEQPAVPESLS